MKIERDLGLDDKSKRSGKGNDWIGTEPFVTRRHIEGRSSSEYGCSKQWVKGHFEFSRERGDGPTMKRRNYNGIARLLFKWTGWLGWVLLLGTLMVGALEGRGKLDGCREVVAAGEVVPKVEEDDVRAETGAVLWKFVPTIGVLVTAVATGVAAAGAWAAAQASKRAAQGQLFFMLLSDYSSEEMHEALKKIGGVKVKKDGDGVYWQTLLNHWADNRHDRENIEAAYPGVNDARRRVSHYFLRALELYENKECIDTRFLEVICEGHGFVLLYHVVEHLEKALNPGYAHWKFDRLLELCGRSEEDKGRLRRVRASL